MEALNNLQMFYVQDVRQYVGKQLKSTKLVGIQKKNANTCETLTFHGPEKSWNQRSVSMFELII